MSRARPCLRDADVREVSLQVQRQMHGVSDPSRAIRVAEAPRFAPENRSPRNGDEWRYLFLARIAVDAASFLFFASHAIPLALSTFALLPFAAPPAARTPWRFWFFEGSAHLIVDAALERWASFALTAIAMCCYFYSVRAGRSWARSQRK